jgi:hypothetical protein
MKSNAKSPLHFLEKNPLYLDKVKQLFRDEGVLNIRYNISLIKNILLVKCILIVRKVSIG